MGVSPNTYEGQNRMPPPNRKRSTTSQDRRVGAGTKTVIKNGKPVQKPLDGDYEYYSSEDEQGRRIQKVRKKQKAAARKARSKDRVAAAINKPRDSSRESGRAASLGRAGATQRSQTMRDAGASVIETASAQEAVKRKPSKKKKASQPVRDYGGAYFKHTNFERAVIATNGRAPYNNREVEVITKPDGFDPNSYSFKNNWVNNLMRSNHKSPRGNGSPTRAANMTGEGHMGSPGRLDGGISSASHTATTVFPGVPKRNEDSFQGSKTNLQAPA